MSAPNVRAAEVVLPCEALDVTQAFFAERLGFRVDVVFPADDRRLAVMSGHGVRIRLVRGADGAPGRSHRLVPVEGRQRAARGSVAAHAVSDGKPSFETRSHLVRSTAVVMFPVFPVRSKWGGRTQGSLSPIRRRAEPSSR